MKQTLDQTSSLPVKKENRNTWQWYHTLSVVVFIVLVILIGFFVFPWSPTKGNPASTLMTWGIIGVATAFLIIFVGYGITGELLGALINDHNRMSLSQLQLITWITVILSALFTAVLWNLSIHKSNPLAIALPPQIWLLLGISLSSLIGSPLILSTKTSTPANQEEAVHQLELKGLQIGQAETSNTQQGSGEDQAQKPVVQLGPNANSPTPPKFHPGPDFITKLGQLKAKLGIDIQGQVIHFQDPRKATLADLFQGDEVGNFAQVDLGKIQMFLFTLILVVVYASALSTTFIEANPTTGITSFPALDQSMIVLLAISHAGYLAHKAVPHTATP